MKILSHHFRSCTRSARLVFNSAPEQESQALKQPETPGIPSFPFEIREIDEASITQIKEAAGDTFTKAEADWKNWKSKGLQKEKAGIDEKYAPQLAEKRTAYLALLAEDPGKKEKDKEEHKKKLAEFVTTIEELEKKIAQDKTEAEKMYEDVYKSGWDEIQQARQRTIEDIDAAVEVRKETEAEIIQQVQNKLPAIVNAELEKVRDQADEIDDITEEGWGAVSLENIGNYVGKGSIDEDALENMTAGIAMAMTNKKYDDTDPAIQFMEALSQREKTESVELDYLPDLPVKGLRPKDLKAEILQQLETSEGGDKKAKAEKAEEAKEKEATSEDEIEQFLSPVSGGEKEKGGKEKQESPTSKAVSAIMEDPELDPRMRGFLLAYLVKNKKNLPQALKKADLMRAKLHEFNKGENAVPIEDLAQAWVTFNVLERTLDQTEAVQKVLERWSYLQRTIGGGDPALEKAAVRYAAAKESHDFVGLLSADTEGGSFAQLLDAAEGQYRERRIDWLRNHEKVAEVQTVYAFFGLGPAIAEGLEKTFQDISQEKDLIVFQKTVKAFVDSIDVMYKTEGLNRLVQDKKAQFRDMAETINKYQKALKQKANGADIGFLNVPTYGVIPLNATLEQVMAYPGNWPSLEEHYALAQAGLKALGMPEEEEENKDDAAKNAGGKGGKGGGGGGGGSGGRRQTFNPSRTPRPGLAKFSLNGGAPEGENSRPSSGRAKPAVAPKATQSQESASDIPPVPEALEHLATDTVKRVENGMDVPGQPKIDPKAPKEQRIAEGLNTAFLGEKTWMDAPEGGKFRLTVEEGGKKETYLLTRTAVKEPKKPEDKVVEVEKEEPPKNKES